MSEHFLCLVSDLSDPGAKGPFRLGGRAVFVVRRGNNFRAWEDSCPHAFAPLEMEPDHFLDLTGTYVLCTMHGAHFDMMDGGCVMGPCKGRRLTAVPIRVENGRIVAPPTSDLLNRR